MRSRRAIRANPRRVLRRRFMLQLVAGVSREAAQASLADQLSEWAGQQWGIWDPMVGPKGNWVRRRKLNAKGVLKVLTIATEGHANHICANMQQKRSRSLQHNFRFEVRRLS